MHLIVGLGNPGSCYEGTRHNLGYAVVESLSGLVKAPRPARKAYSLYTKARIGNDDILLVQPLTYMNRSGLAVVELLRVYDVSIEKVILIYDDLDLPPGVIRVRYGGSSAGHRGVQSVINSVGTSGFIRLRIGIGKPSPGGDAADYVLERASGDEKTLLSQAVIRAAEAVQAIVRHGLSAAMNEYNKSLSCGK